MFCSVDYNLCFNLAGRIKIVRGRGKQTTRLENRYIRASRHAGSLIKGPPEATRYNITMMFKGF